MRLTRRQALGVFGAAGAVSLLELRGGRALATVCSGAPAETEGPYFVDERLDRADIRVDPSDGTVEPGATLRLDLTVVRVDADCAPAAGVQVDVWHANAAGTYSDEASNGTAGQKSLRGYQVTDTNGAVSFITVYPGWYPGRTIHVHFKLRTFSAGATTYDFTSQIYFDETVNDVVLATSPYAAHGPRDTRNAADTIFDEALVLTPIADGGGGWIGTFTIGVAGLGGMPTSSCDSVTACLAELAAALPDVGAAGSRKAARIARRLRRLAHRASAAIDRAAGAGASRRRRLYARARTELATLVSIATAADGRGTLDASLSAITAATTAVLGFLLDA